MPINGKTPTILDYNNKEKSYFLGPLESWSGNCAIRTGKWSNVIILDCDIKRANNNETDGNKDFADMLLRETGEIDPTE